MTGWTFAFETARSIDALSTTTETRCTATFVNILKFKLIRNVNPIGSVDNFDFKNKIYTHADLHHHCTLETFFAIARKRTVGILTRSISANSAHNVALVNV